MWHSPVNCCSESVAPVGGDVAPSQAAAVDPASDGVVLLACMTNKLELNHECVRSCVLFARPNVVACGRRTRNEWNTPSQPVAHLKKRKKKDALLICSLRFSSVLVVVAMDDLKAKR